MRELKELLERSIFPKQLVVFHPIKYERIEAESRTTFELKVEEIWENLQDKQTTTIGVHGMPGIGKTTALTRIRERASKRSDLFEIVIWIDVSSDSSVSSLQDKIASQLLFSFLNEKEGRYVSKIPTRAAMLRAKLVAKKRFLLILDDVWDVYSLSDVGIPSPAAENGCKIVLTTRSISVCEGMGAKKLVIEPRPKIEAIRLFKDNVGDKVCGKLLYDRTLASIMEQIVQECAGLPLALVTTARGLKDTTDPIEWEDALYDLKELSQVSEPIKRVIQILKLSYDRLNEGLKKCLLYCALFPEDHEIGIEFLVEHLIVEQIIERNETRELDTERGREMVKQLQDVSLLSGSISGDGEACVKMHDLIRDMALQIESERYKVRAGAKWESIPEENKWNDDLSKVSLVNIRSVALNSSPPNTPRLSTLFLYHSYELDYVLDEFFLHMKGLSVLNLSFTAITKLPESVSDLVSLTALFLRNCSSLRHVPSLAKLKKITTLDFYSSGIKFVPEGLDMLINLRYLNFDRCPLFIMPRRVLRKFVNLQYLALPHSQPARQVQQGPKVKAEDLELLTKLESFEGVLYDVSDFNAYVESLERKTINDYALHLGFSDSYVDYTYDEDHDRIVCLTGSLQGLTSTSEKTRECLFSIPKDVNALVIRHCHNSTSGLRDFTRLSDMSELRLCDVEDCGGIEYLFSCSSEDDENEFPLLPKLKTLNLDGVRDLVGLVKAKIALPLLPSSFSLLRELSMRNCNNVKTLFAFEVGFFSSLEQLILSRCESLEEIASTDHFKGNMVMPRLRRVVLSKLPKLRKIPVIADLLQEVHIEECPKLRKIDPLLDGEHCSNLLMHVYIDRDTWWLLEWENQSAKDFVASRMNLTNDNSDVDEGEAMASAATAMSPTSFEEDEAAALFRRSLDLILGLFQWDFKNLDEVITLFRTFSQDGEEQSILFQKDFDEIAASLFRRNLEDEEKEEVTSFHRNLKVLLVAFSENKIKFLATLRNRLQVEACVGRNLELTSLYWWSLGSEVLNRRDYAQATVASALLRRNTRRVSLMGDNSEAVASYTRNSAVTPLCSNIAAAEAATLFRMKLDDVVRWSEENLLPLAYLIFIPRTGYYETGNRLP